LKRETYSIFVDVATKQKFLEFLETNFPLKKDENRGDQFKKFVNSLSKTEIPVYAEEDTDYLARARTLTMYVNLETDVGITSPTLSQILIRKITPERYFETQKTVRRIRNITYTLEYPDIMRRQIDEEEFRTIFDKCRETVESNVDIVRMRALEEKLRIDGKELKTKLFQLCKQ